MTNNIGQRIRYYRSENNLTQAELAGKLSVKPSAVSSWEIGRTEPNLGQLSTMSKLFGVSMDELVGLNNKPEPDIHFETQEVDFSTLIQYMQMPAEKRKLVDEYIRFIANQK